jgi:hypothetical protein
MLPGDTYREEKDQNSPFPPGLANALQRDLSVLKASESEGTFPSPAGSSGAWGGARRIVACFYGADGGGADLADGGVWTVDSKSASGIDWRNRVITIVDAWFMAANEGDNIPGGGGEPLAQPNIGGAFIYPDWSPGHYGCRTFYTKDGSADPAGSGTPPAGYHYQFRISGTGMIASLHVAADGSSLRFANHLGAAMGGVFLVLDVFDQFPTRVGY